MHTHLRIRAQGGYFFPEVVTFPQFVAGDLNPPYYGQNASLAALWDLPLNADCVAAYNASYCTSVYGFYPFIKTPCFITENAADSNQVRRRACV